MAQTNFTPISLYYSTTVAAVPTAGNLVAGELAINTQDGKLFYKDAAGVVQTIASKDVNSGTFTNISVSGVASFADGTVSLPSITNIGDTNTGIFFPAADTIAFTEGGTEAMRINSNGDVGIGVTSVGARLDVATTSSTQARFTRTGQTAVCTLYQSSADTYLSATNSGASLILATQDTERMRVNAGAPILCLAGGNTSATGTGIAFPATQSASSDANTLDDYEEGTFTANVVCDSGSVTQTNNTGAYTKIGRLVTVTCYIQMTSVSSPTGKMRITLPFSSASGVQFESSACFAFNNIVSGNIVDFAGVVNNNSSNFDIFTGATTALTSTSANQMQANTSFRFSASYMTA